MAYVRFLFSCLNLHINLTRLSLFRMMNPVTAYSLRLIFFSTPMMTSLSNSFLKTYTWITGMGEYCA